MYDKNLPISESVYLEVLDNGWGTYLLSHRLHKLWNTAGGAQKILILR